MVKHIVTFKLNGTLDERRALARRFADALSSLPSLIPVLQSIEVGINQNPTEQWDLVLTALVPTLDDVVAYANHPAHLAAAAIVKGHVDSRACVDYEK